MSEPKLEEPLPSQPPQPQQPARDPTKMLSLPLRPKKAYKDSSRPLDLVTNHFLIRLPTQLNVYIYSFAMDPDVARDNRKLVNEIMTSARDRIREDLGQFVRTGWMIYGQTKPKFQSSTSF